MDRAYTYGFETVIDVGTRESIVAGSLILEEKLQTFTRGQFVWLILGIIVGFASYSSLPEIDFDDALLWILASSLGALGVGSIPAVFIASWMKTFTSVRVFSDRVEVVNRFLVNNSRRIEGSKIESIDFSQSILGRSAYGIVIIRGSGMAAVSVSPVRNPENLAEAVRGISSKSAPKSEEPAPRTSDAAGSLAELISMKEQGHLTEEEFTAAKKKILG